MQRRIFFTSLLFIVGIGSIWAQQQDVVSAADKFLNSLSTEVRNKAQYPLDDLERFNWFFVPHERNGPTFYDFNETQKNALMALLQASLSDQGYQKAMGIVSLENILKVVEGRKADDHYRDPLNYHVTFFGIPSPDKPWFWRFEGHHVSISFSFNNGKMVSSTPSFFGSNPGIVLTGEEKGKQMLKLETDLGFSLVNSLNPAQLITARFAEKALDEIVTGNDRKAKQLEPQGIKYNALTDEQKKTFLQLLDVYVRNYELGFSNTLMDKVKKAGIENLSFAWAGSLTPGVGHYYRIQGPMLLIEYDNTQNKANHVHTVVRDLTNDFAEDILREHYEKAHKK